VLAILGGEPVRRAPWPQWPAASPGAIARVEEVLRSAKWTVSGQALMPAIFDREIAERWASYLGVRHALSCSSGTAGLAMALEALAIGPGDEVIVPGMTWVAVPQSVYNVGARPVMVDIDPDTLSLCPKEVERAISPKTKAVLVVHAYCGLADMDAIMALSKKHDLAVIEDGSQAHGAAWRGRQVGSFGHVSVFSAQQSKLLTCGEGGLVATDDPELHERMQYARMDGRRLSAGVSPDNWMSIEGEGRYQGRNFNLTEIGCALLLGGLDELDGQNDHRADTLAHLASALQKVGGVAITGGGRGTTRRSIWRLTCRIERSLLADVPARLIGRAVTAELGLPVEPIDTPLNRNPLYNPLKVPRIARRPDASNFDPTGYSLPNANSQYDRILALPQFALLAGRKDMNDIAEAFGRVFEQIAALKGARVRGLISEGSASR
jgi:dTDP-4-amino-4,6-dideoxygalactose transaminase